MHRAVTVIDKILGEINNNIESCKGLIHRHLEVTSFSKVLVVSRDVLDEIKDACVELNYIYSGVHRLGIYMFNFTEIAKYVEETKNS